MKLRPIFAALVVILATGCAKTQVALENATTGNLLIDIKPNSDAAGTRKIDFGTVAASTKSPYKEVDWTDSELATTKVSTHGGSGKEGVVTLRSGKKSLIRITTSADPSVTEE